MEDACGRLKLAAKQLEGEDGFGELSDSISAVCGSPVGSLPDGIVEEIQSFVWDIEMDSASGESVVDAFSTQREPMTGGITGLYFPEDRLMLADPRNQAHHNDQINYSLREYGEMSPVLPWATTRFGEDSRVEFSRSHGGLSQALIRNDLEDVEVIRGIETTPNHVVSMAYSCRLLDIPGDAEVEYKYVPEQIANLEDHIKAELSVSFETAPMQSFYQEFQFSNAGLPDPLFGRGL
jgi:hypothetical protein